LKDNPNTIRVFGLAEKHSGEPGYASESVDFRAVRDPLAWSLPLVWHLNSSNGNTPMISRRLVDFGKQKTGMARYDLEGDTHLLTGRGNRSDVGNLPSLEVGAAVIRRNSTALPRARLVGRPVYAADQVHAVAAMDRLGALLRDQLVVEDPDHPLAVGANVAGKARIVEEIPERVVVETEAAMPSYLVLSDTFDPGWSTTVDGRPAPIRPAYIAFRAVFLTAGKHTVVFSYRPAGFEFGLGLTACGIVLGLLLWFRPAGLIRFSPDHLVLNWPPSWRKWWFIALGGIVLVSAVGTGPVRLPTLHARWKESVHQHTWGAGLKAMKRNRM
jgi:hypothetical protein